MTTVWRAFLFVFLPITLHAAANEKFRVPDVINLDDLAQELKLDAFKGKKFGRKLKLAVFDNGFLGLEAELGKNLPPACPAAGSCTQYHDDVKTIADTRENKSPHGTQMAKIVYQLLKRSGADFSVEFHLYNTYGYPKLKAAVEDVAKSQFDVVLYSQVWEWGGNLDGRGFINALVDQALSSGVIWLNAAGDFGRTTRVAPVDVKDGWVNFAKGGDGVTIVCDRPTCDLSVSLTWNDFKDDTKIGTDKDLDLVLLDAKGKLVPLGEHYAGSKKQAIKPPDTEEYSYFPREFVESDANGESGPKPLTRGTYKLRVKAVSSNFDAQRDSLRITVLDGNGVEVKDPDTEESLLIPADNPGVIVVGAFDTATSGKSKRLGLPQIHLSSVIKLEGGAIPYSTSNSTAMAAAVSLLNLGVGTEKTVAAVTAKLKELTKTPQKNPVLDQKPTNAPPPVANAPAGSASGASTSAGVPQLSPAPRTAVQLEGFDPKCRRLDPRGYPELSEIVRRGGVVLKYRGRVVVSVNYDFLEDYEQDPGPNRGVYITPEGPKLYAHSVRSRLPANYYEVIMRGIAMCL